MALHCMLDLETWGTGQDAVVISIGAVKFDPQVVEHGQFHDEFHVGIDPETYAPFLATKMFAIEPGTVKWWMGANRREALDAWDRLQKVDVATALQGFAMWFSGEAETSNEGSTAPVFPNRPEAVWSNGATFDIPIMRHHYAALGLVCPWHFRAERCYRTIYALRGARTESPPAGLMHDALSDAKWQADKLCMMLKGIV